MDSEVFYDGVSQVAGYLRGIEQSLDEMTSKEMLVFHAAAIVLPHLVMAYDQQGHDGYYDPTAVKRAVCLGRMLADQIWQPKEVARARAEAAEEMPSNSGPLVGDETVYLGEEPKPFAPWEDE